MSEVAAPGSSAASRAALDGRLLRHDDADADPDAVPVPRRDVHVHGRDGRRADHLPRRLDDDRRTRTAARSTASRPTQFAAYYIVWTFVRVMNIVFTPYGWEQRIREGQLSGQLLRPLHPIHYDLALVRRPEDRRGSSCTCRSRVGLSLVFHPALHPSALGIVVFLIAIWGAYLIRSLNQFTLGMVTFWTTRVGAIFQIWFLAELLLSGPAAAAAADAALDADARRLAAVQVDVLLPDRGARRAHVEPRAAARARLCRRSGA